LPRRPTSASIDIDFKFITSSLHLTDYLDYIDPAANASQKDCAKLNPFDIRFTRRK
jgi:hypothetical protein